MERVSNLMGKVLSKRGLKDEAKASHVVFLASEWITKKLPDISPMLHPKRLEGTVLKVDSDHSLASQELRNVSEELKEYLSKHAECSVTEVSIQLATPAN